MKITCIGSGVFGIAIAKSLARKQTNEVFLWTHDENFKRHAEQTNELAFDSKKCVKDKNIYVTTSFSEALKDTKAIFLLVNSIYLKEIILEMKKDFSPNIPIFNCSKGLLSEKPYYYSRFLKTSLNVKKTAFLAGPNFAEDLIKGAITTITVATKEKKTYLFLKSLFTRQVKFEWMKEEKALELTSALKNVYAIGAGMVYAKSPYESTVFSYLTEAYREYLQILYQELDYPSENIYAGTLGDFFLTGSNISSRNFTYGRIYLQTKKEAKLFLEQNTVEGVTNLKALAKILKKKDKFPLFYEIWKIVS